MQEGQSLLQFDLEKIAAAGHPDTVVIVVTNSDDFSSIQQIRSGSIKAEDDMLKLKR